VQFRGSQSGEMSYETSLRGAKCVSAPKCFAPTELGKFVWGRAWSITFGAAGTEDYRKRIQVGLLRELQSQDTSPDNS
jgi:hypothetical protein